MLDISDFQKNEFHLKLGDGTWQHALVADISTDSLFWSRATFVQLPKLHAEEPVSALIYLLEKEARHLGLWQQEWGAEIPSVQDFIQHLSIWGRFTNTAGIPMSIDEFWKSYEGTVDGITSQPAFEYSEEETVKPYTPQLVKEDIQQVFCFDNEWNEQNFLIETAGSWILFNWVTMA